jgi:hypothetical protein
MISGRSKALEVIYSKNENVIPYDKDIIIFHGAFEYDKDANAVGEMDKDAARKLAGMLKQINADVQKTFNLDSLEWIKLPTHINFASKRLEFHRELEKLQKQFGLSDNARVVEWHFSWWKNFIKRQARKMRYQIPRHIVDGLVRRWATFDKTMSLNELKKEIENPKFFEWVRSYDKKNHQQQFKENMFPFEILFLKLGAEVMKNMKQFLSANPGSAAEKIRQRIEADIKTLEKTKDVRKTQRIDNALRKINALGGFDAILPTEGIVFLYKGKTYKLTGIFAPVNQLMGLLTFG